MAKKTKVKAIKTGVERGNKGGRAKTEKLEKRKTGETPQMPAKQIGRIVKKVGRAKGGKRSTHKLINVNPAKRFRQFIKNYDEAVKRGDLKPIKEIEDLRKRFAWNKDGSPDMRGLRTNEQRKKFNEAIKAFNKKYKRWGKKAVAEMGEEQRKKTRRRLEQGEQTFTRNEEKRRERIKEQFGYDFKGQAESTLSIYQRTADLFGSDVYQKLVEQFNLGSDTAAMLADMMSNASKEDIENYIQDFLNGIENLPKEARALASEDEMRQALFDMVELAGTENVADTLRLYLEASDAEERENIIEMAAYHAEHADETNKSFGQFYEDFSSDEHVDQTNEKTWGEYL